MTISRALRLVSALILFVFLVPAWLTPPSVTSQPDLKGRIKRVYIELVEAEQRGANVSEVSFRLNQAVQIANQAESTDDEAMRSYLLSMAERIVDEVQATIPGLIVKGESETQAHLVSFIETSLVVVIGGSLVYCFAPRILWEFWLEVRRDWKVKRRD